MTEIDMEEKQFRYPGTRPFAEEDQKLFFGRDNDIAGLTRMVDLRSSVTLFGQSGLGKSSLISAGLIPSLMEEGYLPIRIRFGYYQEGGIPALGVLEESLELPDSSYLAKEFADEEPSFWQMFKEIQLDYASRFGENPVILLLFDQFEEFFSYPDSSILFGTEISALLNDQMPKSLSRKLISDHDWLTDEVWNQIHLPLQVKTLFSIRSDKLSQLDKLGSVLPDILQHRYELQPLDIKQARSAIISPATLAGDFATQPYAYTEAAVNKMLSDLTGEGKQSVAPFQLQTYCQYIEQQIVAKSAYDEEIVIESIQLPNFEELFHNYYQHAIAEIEDPSDQQKARMLLEDGLILHEEERRITVDQGQIERQFGIQSPMLRKLVALRLVRAEPNRTGGFSYELSHDSLVSPILNSRKERIEAELEIQKIEEAKSRQKKQIRNILLGAGLLILLLMLGSAGIIFQRNMELTRISSQLLRAYNELGGFINLEGGDLISGDPEVRALDLTIELEKTKEAVHETRQKLLEFQKQAAQLEERLEAGDLSQSELISLFRNSKGGIDSIVESSPILKYEAPISMESIDISTLDNMIESFYAEAKRLEERKDTSAAIRKYRQIILYDTSEVKAKSAVERLSSTSLRKKKEVLRQNSDNDSSLDQDPTPRDTVYGLPTLPQERKRSDEQPQNHSDPVPGKDFANELELAEDLFISVSSGDTDWDKVISQYERARQSGAPDGLINYKLGEINDLIGKEMADGNVESFSAVEKEQTRGLDSNNFIPGPDPNPIIPEVVPVPGGTFMMGSEDGSDREKPVHTVTVSSFSMSQYEITNEQYAAFLTAKGNQKEGGVTWYDESGEGYNGYAEAAISQDGEDVWVVKSGRENHPVNYVSWFGARAYCAWLTEVSLGNYRLPTEAEWEYAAGGGMEGRDSLGYRLHEYAGADRENLNEVAWYTETTNDTGTREVGTKRANELGLYDMSGNVWEWCADWYGETYYQTSVDENLTQNPKGPPNGDFRVLRGGSWYNDNDNCRVSNRGSNYPDNRNDSDGFRVVRN